MQRLENLEITKVAFVPEGDNKKADVLLFKSKPPEVNPSPPAQDAETNVIKKVLLAIGKALGFDGSEPVPEPTTPTADPETEPKPQTTSPTEPTVEEPKGDNIDMKIDKSKLNPEELAALEAIEKKAGVQDEPAPATDPVEKNAEPAAPAAPAATEPTSTEPAGEDIYKGLHPAVAAELKELRKRADAAEERELQSVAKKYEILGKKPEELAKTLKSLKDAGGTAYDDMIGVLDQSLTMVEKSGAFTEIGKKGNGGTPDAWAQIEKHADEIQKNAPTLTRNQAIDKACEQHPDLVAEYENQR